MRSPWWYRRRDAVFGIIYGIGFTAGGISFSAHPRYVPLFINLGSRSGAVGIGIAAAVMLVLMAGCFALRLWGSSYLRADVVWSDDSRTDSLIVAGPFRYVRNPLYLGNVLMALGMGAFAPAVGWAVINLLNMAFIAALIHWEELGLRERYGEQFTRYCAAVPALFPRMVPVQGNAQIEPSIKQGMRAEIFVGCLLLGMILVFVVPGIYKYVLFAMLYVVGIALQRVAAGGSARTEQVA